VGACPAKINKKSQHCQQPRKEQATYREHFERIPPHIIPIPALDVVYPNEERVIHHVYPLQQLGVPAELLRQQRAFLRAKLKLLAAVDPVEILEHRAWILARPVLRVLPPDGGPLEIVRLVDVLVWREEVVHDHEMDLPTPRQLDAVKTIET
jgi:hypothetical protein